MTSQLQHFCTGLVSAFQNISSGCEDMRQDLDSLQPRIEGLRQILMSNTPEELESIETELQRLEKLISEKTVENEAAMREAMLLPKRKEWDMRLRAASALSTKGGASPYAVVSDVVNFQKEILDAASKDVTAPLTFKLRGTVKLKKAVALLCCPEDFKDLLPSTCEASKISETSENPDRWRISAITSKGALASALVRGQMGTVTDSPEQAGRQALGEQTIRRLNQKDPGQPSQTGPLASAPAPEDSSGTSASASASAEEEEDEGEVDDDEVDESEEEAARPSPQSSVPSPPPPMPAEAQGQTPSEEIPSFRLSKLPQLSTFRPTLETDRVSLHFDLILVNTPITFESVHFFGRVVVMEAETSTLRPTDDDKCVTFINCQFSKIKAPTTLRMLNLVRGRQTTVAGRQTQEEQARLKRDKKELDDLDNYMVGRFGESLRINGSQVHVLPNATALFKDCVFDENVGPCLVAEERSSVIVDHCLFRQNGFKDMTSKRPAASGDNEDEEDSVAAMSTSVIPPTAAIVLRGESNVLVKRSLFAVMRCAVISLGSHYCPKDDSSLILEQMEAYIRAMLKYDTINPAYEDFIENYYSSQTHFLSEDNDDDFDDYLSALQGPAVGEQKPGLQIVSISVGRGAPAAGGARPAASGLALTTSSSAQPTKQGPQYVHNFRSCLFSICTVGITVFGDHVFSLKDSTFQDSELVLAQPQATQTMDYGIQAFDAWMRLQDVSFTAPRSACVCAVNSRLVASGIQCLDPKNAVLPEYLRSKPISEDMAAMEHSLVSLAEHWRRADGNVIKREQIQGLSQKIVPAAVAAKLREFESASSRRARKASRFYRKHFSAAEVADDAATGILCIQCFAQLHNSILAHGKLWRGIYLVDSVFGAQDLHVAFLQNALFGEHSRIKELTDCSFENLARGGVFLSGSILRLCTDSTFHAFSNVAFNLTNSRITVKESEFSDGTLGVRAADQSVVQLDRCRLQSLDCGAKYDRTSEVQLTDVYSENSPVQLKALDG